MEPIDALSRECFRSFAVLPGARLISTPEIFGVRTEVPATFFNGIATTELQDDPDGGIERAIAEFAGVPFRWWITPATRPDGLPARLAAHGLTHVYDSTAMLADLTTPVAPASLIDATIRRVETAEELRMWCEVLLTVFHRSAEEKAAWLEVYARLSLQDAPAWTHFLAFSGGTPVATTSLLLAGDLAGIYHVATMPEARGRGIGAEITATALRYARDHGARQAVLQASDMAVGVYRRIGFVETPRVTLYEWRPPAPG